MHLQAVCAIQYRHSGGVKIGDLVIGRDGFAFGVKYNSPETMPKEANTYLYVDNGQVRLANYKDGQRTSDIGIMESIADIQVLNEKVVMVTFSDGKTEKAVIDTYDTFNIEQGIIFESVKSVMKAYGWGYKNCVSAEKHTLTPEQIDLLIKLRVNVVLAYDSDVNYFKDGMNVQSTGLHMARPARNGFCSLYGGSNIDGKTQSVNSLKK